jgi:peptide/nickel transport system substrate-binding protein
MAMRVMDVSNPHAISFDEGGFPIRVCVDHLTRTAQDNITRPWLLQGWDVSDDLRTWTLNLRPGVNWANGRAFTPKMWHGTSAVCWTPRPGPPSSA